MRHSLFVLLLLLSITAWTQTTEHVTVVHGGLVRGDSTKKEVALIFTADEWGEGLPLIRKTLNKERIKAGFFFTGRFYRHNAFQQHIRQLAKEGHYLGPHSDQHLLYCDWTKRDSLLVKRDSFALDMARNMEAMKALGLPVHTPHLFVPPYEWWNDSIAAWSRRKGLTVFSFTPGIRTNADYTFPEMGTAYKSTNWILQWLKESVEREPHKWNGAVILVHAGTDPRRKDKLYNRLREVIQYLEQKGYRFRRLDALFNPMQKRWRYTP
jgi:peptidoglycan/xylan/chitin deacetylase (PgdA/CDA1 family)